MKEENIYESEDVDQEINHINNLDIVAKSRELSI